MRLNDTCGIWRKEKTVMRWSGRLQ